MSQYKHRTVSVVNDLLHKSGLSPRILETDLVTRVLLIGPREAAAMMKANYDNRPLRPSRVNYYRDIINAGEFKLTHQGIAFSKTGRGLDLQHRLQAIIESGKTVPLLVTEGLSDDDYSAIDQHAQRSIADSLERPKKTVEEARFLAAFCWGANYKHDQLNSTILAMVDLIEDTSEQLHSICAGKYPAGRSNSVTRSAAIVTMLLKPNCKQDILWSYNVWAKSKSEHYSLSMHSFARKITQIKALSIPGRNELLLRSMVIFDPDTSHIQNVKCNEIAIQKAKKQMLLVLPKPQGITVRHNIRTKIGHS